MERIETTTAVIERTTPELVICRYKNGVTLTASIIAENVQARMCFLGNEPYAVIGVFPEDMDFEMSMLEKDHYMEKEVNQITQVLALVAEGNLFDTIARMYLALKPTPFGSTVFRTEEEALAWVGEKIKSRQEA